MTENRNEPNSQTACDIARDLMALRIENLCSESSATLVEEHIATCPECAAVYAALQEKPPVAPPPPPADLSFSNAFRQMLRTIRLRTVALVLLGVLIGAFGLYGFNYLFIYGNMPVPLSDARYSLSLLPSGAVIETMDAGRFELSGHSVEYDFNEVAYVTLHGKLPLPWGARESHDRTGYHALLLEDGVLYLGGFDNTNAWNPRQQVIREIRLGDPRGKSVPIYKQGDTIPPCPTEKAAQYELLVQEYIREMQTQMRYSTGELLEIDYTNSN